ncbi:hypothetical protein A9G42_05775 [Gilliamella sp. Nev6-6]|nr:hypothetical protein A9G42_05775 [Gilliamella apicola]
MGDVGASIAASKNAVENNRLTTRRENKRIRKLAKGDKQEELRYLAAACALIKCSSELADNDPQKAALRELEKLGSSDELQAYRETLAAQEHTKNRTIFGIPYQKNEKLFQYTFFDGIFDGTKNIDNEYSITTRAGGVLQIGFAAIDGFGAAALSPGCSSVVGCIPSAYLTWSMADNGVTGAMTVYYGKTYHTQTAEGLAKILGVSVSDAELLFSLSTAGVTAKGFSDLAWKARATGQKLSAKEVEQISEGINRVKAGKEPILPNGYTQQGNNIIGPKGGVYTHTGKFDAAGNPIYTNNGAYYTLENGVKTKVKSPNTNTSSQAQQNYQQGKQYEQTKYDEFSSTQEKSAREVLLETENGNKIRLDMIGKDKNGNITCIECKSSGKAPLTLNQKVGFPDLEKNGGTIIGDGKPGFERGTKIPPTKVEVVRPDN